MPTYRVLHKGVLVGHSSLEHGDPPMGVAFGAFVPTAGYDSIAEFCKSNHLDQSQLALVVQAEDGLNIPCVGVGVLDYSGEGGEHYAELNVLGIEHDVYAALFPQHVAAYDGRFAASKGTE